MPLPWIPLLTITAALAADEAETRTKVKSSQGDLLDRTIFDLVEDVPEIQRLVQPVAKFIAQGMVGGKTLEPSRTLYEATSYYMARMLGLQHDSPQILQISHLVHGLAKAEVGPKVLWSLEEEAYLALTQTETPWDLIRDTMPRMPVPAMWIRIPASCPSIPIKIVQETSSNDPNEVLVRSILILEEVPGAKIRMLGFNDAHEVTTLAYCKGYLDLRYASAKAQIVEGDNPDAHLGMSYAMTGDDQIWRLVLNLLLALDNRHLEGLNIQNPTPKSNRKLAKASRRKSFQPYTIVRLSGSTRDALAIRERAAALDAEAEKSSVRRHLRTGHWRSVWVLDPGDKPVYATKPRADRTGGPIEGYLYRTVTWIFPMWVGHGETMPSQKGRVML